MVTEDHSADAQAESGVHAADVPEEGLTIDGLARRSGMTTRNIRAYQTRGLLAPPVMRGRTGVYGSGHVARLELIRRLQGEGLNLQAIKWLLEAVPIETAGAVEEALWFQRALFASWAPSTPVRMTTAELAAKLGTSGLALLDRAVALGVFRPAPPQPAKEGAEPAWLVLQPELLHAGEQLAGLGVSLEAALDTMEAVRDSLTEVAHRFVDLFHAQVWQPFAEAGSPAEGWPAMREALARVSPLAREAVLALFRQEMARAVSEVVGEVVGDQSGAASRSAPIRPASAIENASSQGNQRQ